MKEKSIGRIWWALLAGVIALTLALTTGVAHATPPVQHKVTICHAHPADSLTGPWVSITVDIASTGYQHSGHQDEHDGDIIPPYSYDDDGDGVPDFEFAGKNWDEVGQAVYANDCVAPGETPPPPVEPEPSLSASAFCITDGTQVVVEGDADGGTASPALPFTLELPYKSTYDGVVTFSYEDHDDIVLAYGGTTPSKVDCVGEWSPSWAPTPPSNVPPTGVSPRSTAFTGGNIAGPATTAGLLAALGLSLLYLGRKRRV